MSIYHELAPWYDRFMSFMDYETESADLANFLLTAVGPGCRGLDLGVGSGNHLLPLLRQGLQVEGLDNSEPMLAVLKEKLTAAGLSTRLICGDMRSYQQDDLYDVVYSWGDTVHHLNGEEDIQRFFAAARGLLKDGGLLALTWRQREYFDELEDNGAFYERHGEDYLLWDGSVLSADSASLSYTAFLKKDNGDFRRVEETHIVSILDRPLLLRCAGDCGLTLRDDLAAGCFGRYMEEEPFREVTVLQK